MARRSLTDKQIHALKFPKRTTVPITDTPGLYLRCTPNGVKTFVAVARDLNGKQHWLTIGRTDEITLDTARSKAAGEVRAIKSGAATAKLNSFQTIADEWFKRVVEAKAYITAANKRRYLDNHILPVLGARDFTGIKRIDIAQLLDGIEDTSGPAAADEALSIVRAIGNWYATRNDDYVSPVVRGMKRNDAKSRDRVLTDDEIRQLFGFETNATTSICKLLLLTGQRRTTVAAMRWEDIALDVWSIPNGGRQKGTGGELVLPEVALAIINAQPRFAGPWVFPGAGSSHFKSYSVHKAVLGVDWRFHDLRRTARSLMSRAGVMPHIAERVLGHAINGVEGIYDRHSYAQEKAHALKALASVIDSILAPPADNVVPIASKR
jgi:integrase